MNRYRHRPDHIKAAAKDSKLDVGDGTDSELVSKADDIYSVASAHRDTVIAKDKAARTRRKGARSRG